MNMIPLLLTAAVDPTKVMEFADAIPFGLKTTLLGMGVVFAVLIILWIILSVFKFVFYKPAGGDTKTEAPVPAAPAPAAPAPVQSAPAADDEELVAVITAAVASMMDKPATSFRVVSFRRTASK